jgi:hypothetical protein
MRRLACLVLVVAGCGVSVQHTQVGPRAFHIEAEGDHADEDDALASVHERARQLCPQGYGIVQTSSSEWRRYGNGGYAAAWHKKSHAALTVECAPEPQTCATPSCGPTASR